MQKQFIFKTLLINIRFTSYDLFAKDFQLHAIMSQQSIDKYSLGEGRIKIGFHVLVLFYGFQ